MKRAFLLGLLCLAANWRVAEPGWEYVFPRDHHAHREFKTEWWYFTGNLADASGRQFGYQLTFFRQGVLPVAERPAELSRFVVGDLKFAHFTVTDVAGKRFRFAQKTSRGAFGEAGFDDGDRLAWLDTWELRMDESGRFHLRAEGDGASVDLQLETTKPPVIHGEDGVSAKAVTAGHASHYYSLTRLATAGQLQVGAERFAVRGESWFDHEWATNQLGPDQIGWNWLSLQLDDGRELMLYQMRLADGSPDPISSGTLVARDGASKHLTAGDFTMKPLSWWKSGKTGANYPIAWRVELPEEKLALTVRAVLENQELALLPLAYWEGAVEAEGKAVKGRGYLELTGYAGPLRALQR